MYEKITGLLDTAAQDAAIPPEDFRELLEDVSDFCEAGIESLAEEAGEGGEEGGGGGDADEGDDDHADESEST